MVALADVGRTKVDVRHPRYWSATLNSSAAQSATQLVAAPGVGLHLVLTDIAISSVTSQTTKLLGATTDIYEIVYTGAAAISGNHVNNLVTPIALASNVALNVTSSAAVAHSITVSGYTEPD